MNGITIRYLSPGEVLDHLRELVDLYREVYAEWPYHEGEPEAELFAERLASQSSREGFSMVVAELDHRVVGYAYGVVFGPEAWWSDADRQPSYVRGQSKFAVMEFLISKELRERGLGTDLMNHLISARSEKYFTLCTHPESLARKIYQHWGWQEVARASSPGLPTMAVLLLQR